MPRVGYPSDKQDQYMVRFPDGMRAKLKQAAKDNTRSLNSEIIARLDRSFAIEEANELARQRWERGEPPENVPFPTDSDNFESEPADPEVWALTARLDGNAIADKLEAIIKQLAEVREENQFLHREVSALYRQVPKDGS